MSAQIGAGGMRRARRPLAADLEQALGHRQPESDGLARSSFGRDDQVAADRPLLEHRRLDRSRLGVALVDKGLGDQRGKGRERHGTQCLRARGKRAEQGWAKDA